MQICIKQIHVIHVSQLQGSSARLSGEYKLCYYISGISLNNSVHVQRQWAGRRSYRTVHKKSSHWTIYIYTDRPYLESTGTTVIPSATGTRRWTQQREFLLLWGHRQLLLANFPFLYHRCLLGRDYHLLPSHHYNLCVTTFWLLKIYCDETHTESWVILVLHQFLSELDSQQNVNHK